jgi:cell division protein ZapB
MEHDLSVLENKLAELIKVSAKLRAENHQLRQELAQTISHSRQSNDKLDTARVRLEKLLASLPVEEETA